MSVREKGSRGRTRFPRGGIGSYGNYPRDVKYDHDSFLSEMVPVSFRAEADPDPYVLTGKVFANSIQKFNSK